MFVEACLDLYLLKKYDEEVSPFSYQEVQEWIINDIRDWCSNLERECLRRDRRIGSGFFECSSLEIRLVRLIMEDFCFLEWDKDMDFRYCLMVSLQLSQSLGDEGEE